VKLQRLKEWRESRGFSQRELSLEAHVAEKTVARIELGDSVRPTTARKVADALGVEVIDLMGEPPVPLGRGPSEPGQRETGPAEAGSAVVAVGMTSEEATENLEQQLYSPAKIAQGWYQLAQLFSDELEKVEKGDSEAGSLEILIDTLEHVVLGMEANVASEKKELKARYEDEDTIRSKAVLSPAMVRLAVVVEEVLQKIAREQLEVKAESADKLVRLENRFKMAS